MKLIQYHNDINKLKLGNFTENETDIFFSLLFKAKDTKDNNIIMDFSELKRLIDVKHRNNDRFIQNVRGLNIKLKSLIQEIELPNGDFKVFSLFDDITTSPSRHQVEVEINKNFRYLIEDLVGNYTELDLKQLVSLKGNYPKVLYRLLKQFETSKLYIVKIDDFRELMGIPSTYEMYNIRQKVLKPCMEQLEQYFKGLELEEVKTGRNVSCLKFRWSKKEKKIIKVNPIPIKQKKVLGEEDLKIHMEQVSKEKEVNPLDELLEQLPIEITLGEYEGLYLAYVEKNGGINNPHMRKTFNLANMNKYKIIG